LILSSFASLGVGMIIAFIFGWKLSLVALAFVPFMVIGGLLQGYLEIGLFSKETKILERAGSVCNLFFQTYNQIKVLVSR